MSEVAKGQAREKQKFKIESNSTKGPCCRPDTHGWNASKARNCAHRVYIVCT